MVSSGSIPEPATNHGRIALDVSTKGLISDVMLLVMLGCFTLATVAVTVVGLWKLWELWRDG